MKITTASIAGLLLASTCYSQAGYVPGKPSFDCSGVNNTVALILCSRPEAARADWDLKSASWALFDTQARIDVDQQAWRQSLDRNCALPRYQTSEEQFGRALGETAARMIFGPGVGIPRAQPINPVHVKCVLNAYLARVAMLRSKLTSDALTESRLSPEQHAELQEALAENNFLRSDETYDAEFGPKTRQAIKQFQKSVGASPSGFLSDDQRLALLERPAERDARRARETADAKTREQVLVAQAAAVAKVRQDAQLATERQAAQDAADRDAKAEKAIEAENKRLDAERKRVEAERKRVEKEADAATEWRLKIDEAHKKGDQYADKSEFKWSLSEIDNLMTDDKDYTVASRQPNKSGAIANVEGTCQKPGRVTFVATLHDASDLNSPLGLPDFTPGQIAGNKRINDDPAFPTRFPIQKFRNSILVSTLLSLEPVESIETTWRVLAGIETARGPIVIQIPMFNVNVQKLLVACAKQYENAKKSSGVPDAPRAPMR